MENTRRPTSHIAPFGLRMQEDLREKIESAATENGRSLNAEIVARLENSIEISTKPDTGLNTETIKKMLLDQEQHLEEKINNAMNELLKVLKP